MAPPVKRAPAAAPPPPAPIGIDFMGHEMYVAGGGIPEGDYALEFAVQMYQALRNNVPQGKPRLGVMVTAYPMAEGALVAGAEPKTKFLSMGGQADQSFAPDPDTGKGLVKIPGAVGATLPDSSNWNIFRKSLYDCGLPDGIVTNDISGLDGIWVHLANIPEPEERKSFGAGKAQTGEVQQEERRGNQTTVVVTEIKEEGKPWEGTGGVPAQAEAPAPAPVAKPGPKGVVRPVVKPKTVPVAAAPAVEAGGEEDLETAAITGVSTVLSVPANAHKIPKLLLKTSTFKTVSAASGAEVAQQVIDTYFSDDATLNTFLGTLGYTINGVNVVPAQ